MSAPRANPRLPAPVKRYRAGQAPINVQESSDEEEEQEDEQEEQAPSIQRRDPAAQSISFGQKEVITGVEQVAISDSDAATDRRLRRLKEAQEARNADHDGRRRRRFAREDEEEADEKPKNESDEEDERAAQRLRMKQRALEQQKAQEESSARLQEAMPIEEEEEEEEEEESSEYETDSSEEYVAPKLIKPVFIPKDRRATVLEKERIAEEEEEAERQRQERLKQRKLESHQLLAEQLKKEVMGEELEEGAATGPPDVDDTDGLDEEAEFEAWKIRELLRIKRDKEERIARDREREEIERRREMPEEERLKEDLERARESRKKERTQHQFMQKYYHKGAFYQDNDDEIFKRDYSIATENEVNKKEMLPDVMQVKKFGMAGQTKYKHLAAEDTTDRTSAWMQKSDVNRRTTKRMGGMKDEYDHHRKRRR